LNEKGEEKYHVSHFERLAPDERIEVEFGNDSESIGYSITDNRGRLKPETVVEKISRHYYRKGVYDESGRGFYLSRMFSSLLIINIEKDKRTQMVGLFHETPKDAAKPLWINYFE
jgi:anti-sigma regulatory factor (Ser/Thr protein kinase)